MTRTGPTTSGRGEVLPATDGDGAVDSTIDLRSDTVTQPDAAMLEAMCTAPLGDDVFNDDPTAHELEEETARILDKEAALFVPSGTMGNSIAIGLATQPGDEAVIEASAHSIHFEVGGAARLWGVQIQAVGGEHGVVPLDVLAEAVRPDDIHIPRTRLIILEQTANLAGGRVLPLSYLQEVAAFCRQHGIHFHIDGARLFNAAVASGVEPAAFARCSDTVMCCLSKGLGAPAGSMLAGPTDLIREGRRLRKLLGGGLRQAGVVAACGLHALRHNVERLADDHRRAAALARALDSVTPANVSIDSPETNMVYLRYHGDNRDWVDQFVGKLRSRGVLAVGLFQRAVRFVFHKDVDEAAARTATRRVVETLRGSK